MKIIAKNKKALHAYDITDTYEAGIVLFGDEVKSIRAGQVSLEEAFATVHRGEITLINCHIAPYSHSYRKVDRSRRSRKLLLHKREINKLIGELARKGLTLVPLKLYINDRGFIKVTLGLGRHKTVRGKKRELRERDIKREAEREMKVKVK